MHGLVWCFLDVPRNVEVLEDLLVSAPLAEWAAGKAPEPMSSAFSIIWLHHGEEQPGGDVLHIVETISVQSNTGGKSSLDVFVLNIGFSQCITLGEDPLPGGLPDHPTLCIGLHMVGNEGSFTDKLQRCS